MTTWIATRSGPRRAAVILRPGPLETHVRPGSVHDIALRSAIRALEDPSEAGFVLSAFRVAGFAGSWPPGEHLRVELSVDDAVQGESLGVGCAAACFDAVLSRLAVAFAVRSPDSDLDLFCTGAIAAGGTVAPVASDGLEAKVKTIADQLSSAPPSRTPLLLVPAAQQTDVEAHVRAVGLDSIQVRGVSALTQVLDAVVEARTTVLTGLWGLAGVAGPVDPVQWAYLPILASLQRAALNESLQQFALAPWQQRTGGTGSVTDMVRDGWRARAKAHPLPDRGRDFPEWFDASWHRVVAARYVDVAAAREPRLFVARAAVASSRPSVPPAADLLEAFLGGQTEAWPADTWRELVDDVRRLGASAVKRAGGRAAELARVVLLAAQAEPEQVARDVQEEVAQLLQSNVIPFPGGHGTPRGGGSDEELIPFRRARDNADPASVMPEPLRWDARTVARRSTRASLSSPLIHVCVYERPDGKPEQVVVTGRGHGRVRPEVDGILTSIGLQLPPAARDLFASGVRVFGAPGEAPVMAALPAWVAVGLGGQGGGGAAQRRTELLSGLVGQLRGLATRTGLVVVETVPSSTLAAVDGTWLDRSPGVGRFDTEHGATAACFLRVGDSGRAAAMSVPPFVFEVPSFHVLVQAWGGEVLDRIVGQLDRRIRFAREREEEARRRREWYGVQKEKGSAPTQQVWADVEVDWDHMILRRSQPRPVPAERYYTGQLESLEEKARKHRLQAVAMQDGVRRARLGILPRLAEQVFADAALRGLEPDEVLADCSEEVAGRYRAWRRAAGPVLVDAARAWCRGVGLDTEERRAQVLTRHVAWRLVVGGGSTLMIPYAVVDTEESRTVFDPERGLRFAVHPLDCATNRPSPAVAPRGGALVELAVEAAQAGDLALATERLVDAFDDDPIRALELLYEAVRSNPKPWSGRTGAFAQAARKMQAFRAVARAHRCLPNLRHGAMDALVQALAPQGDGRRDQLPGALELRTSFAEWERLPELPLMLARLRRDGGTTAGEAALVRLAEGWDPEYTADIELDPERPFGKWAPSEAYRQTMSLRHLSPDEKAAFLVGRVARLYRLADRLAVALRLDWQGATLRRLHLEVGEIADVLADEHFEDFGVGEAFGLLAAGGVISQKQIQKEEGT